MMARRSFFFILGAVALLLLLPIIQAIGQAAGQNTYLPVIAKNGQTTSTATATATSSDPTKPDLEVVGWNIEYETPKTCSTPTDVLGRRVTFRNNGPQPVNVPFVVQIDDDQLTYSAGLAAGQSASLWFAGGAMAGDHNVMVDAGDAVDESNESNNTYQGNPPPVPTALPTCGPDAPTFTPTATSTDETLKADLEITSMIVQLKTGDNCYTSTSLGRRVHFRNNGAEKTINAFVVQADSDQLIYYGQLDPGESASMWFPGGAIAGEHSASIDVTAAIDESDESNNTYQAYLPVPTLPAPCTPTPTTSAIIADHNHTNLSAIPNTWLAEARKFVIHYAHTSHGSQVLSGLEFLAGQDAKYAVCGVDAGSGYDPADLASECAGQDALQIYDGQPGVGGQDNVNYITPDLYWESEDGRARTHLAVGSNVFDITLWTWCGQAGEYESDAIQQYLNFMGSLEGYNGTDLRTILYTGHTNGSGPGERLYNNNALIKGYAIDNGLALYDFYDIERFTPDGSGPYENDGEGRCEWCDNWCAAHPTDCQALPSGCAHSHPLVCKLEGHAYWWLLARMAGWDGVSR